MATRMASKSDAAKGENIGAVRCDRPQNGAEYLGVAARRPRGLHLRRARRRRHDASGVPQYGAHDGAPVRRAARQGEVEEAAAADRHRRQQGQDARVLPGAEDRRGVDRRPRRDRRVAAHHVRLDGPLAGLQGRVPGHARRQRRVLRAVRGEREALVHVLPGARAVREPRDHSSARRPRQAAGPGRRRLRARRQGDRRRA